MVLNLGGASVRSSAGNVAYDTTSRGTLIVRGAGSSWINQYDLHVGAYGDASMIIADGGEVRNQTGFELLIDRNLHVTEAPTEAELRLLRSQMNPHFLFNTLNNIDALIHKDPDRASELLIKLSSEMRYMLYDSNADKVSLASEVEFIKDYVSLQKLRFKKPELIELTVEFPPRGDIVTKLSDPAARLA